ncbi:MAG: formate dehydrogenase-N subunit alpha, partial [Chitinophagales bacterium]
MTNSWMDLKCTDVALVMGSNVAENHPLAMKHIQMAKDDHDAILINVDPRFTRTSSRADIYAPMRSGTDIAFLGGMINYILSKDLYFKEYVATFTNAPFILDDKYGFQDGMFSSWDPEAKKYTQADWVFKMEGEGDAKKPMADPTLQHPRCVLQVMKQHYSRYTLEKVSAVTGTPVELLEKVYSTFASTGKPDKSGVIMYAMGTTQHTVGSQNVRAYAIIQLLLGNIGVPGGGVAAMRGESNVQGSTDYGLLFGNLPAYVNAPKTGADYESLEAYIKKETPKTGFKVNTPKWLVSQLKAWWGDAATKENQFAYHYLPKYDATKNYSFIALFEAMYKGTIKGLFTWGQNPVVGGPNSNKEAKALENLDWYVAADLFETETVSFWKRPGANPAEIKTEVFFLPACSSVEKSGTISNSSRLTQYRWAAIPPLGDSKPDLDILYELGKAIRKAYAGSQAAKDRPILDLTWDYGKEPITPEAVAKEINGYDLKTGKLMAKFADLKDDGSTTSGCWIYCGMFPEEGKYLAARRDPSDKSGIGIYANWAFSWPVNRRILYNRCSADASGKPWSERKKVVWWNPTAAGDPAKPDSPPGAFDSLDVTDFGKFAKPEATAAAPFIMQADGKGGLFAKMNEGPFPEHYEPWESPVKNALSPVQFNPAVKVWEPDKQATPDKYPIVCTTYRVSEHYQSGALTRNQPWLAELQPYMFV